ncbi:MAG: chromosome partitioning protein ParB, partial [Oscillospiraceae bacterium]|nr:chromosome partitioning protein ParB [Oscillospiraceae bacterium]
NQVLRYIRLTHLIPELLDLMDEGKIALMVGEALSYLGDEEQYAVLEESVLFAVSRCRSCVSSAMRIMFRVS